MQNEPLILLVDQRRGSEVRGIYVSGVIEVYVLYELEIKFQKQSYFRGTNFLHIWPETASKLNLFFWEKIALRLSSLMLISAWWSIVSVYIFSFHIQELHLKPYANKTRSSSSQPNYHSRLLLLGHLIMFSSTMCIYINTKWMKY